MKPNNTWYVYNIFEVLALRKKPGYIAMCRKFFELPKEIGKL